MLEIRREVPKLPVVGLSQLALPDPSRDFLGRVSAGFDAGDKEDAFAVEGVEGLEHGGGRAELRAGDGVREGGEVGGGGPEGFAAVKEEEER